MRFLLFAATSSLLIACTIDEPTEGTTNQAVQTHNRLASNRLASNRLASNRLASNRLASNSLSSTRLVALEATADMLATVEGRDVYSYIVGCALPEGMTIEADVAGTADTAPPETLYTCVDGHCTFAGSVGLAPRWAHHRLDRKGQGWVSACLFARVNANDTAEAISLRGGDLDVSSEEMELYTAEEGAFYGNLFIDDPDPEVPPDWHACRGRAKAACPGDTGCGAGLANRDCAQENPATPGLTYCGFEYAGDCGDFAPPKSPYACKSFDADGGTYDDCFDEPGAGRWRHATKYREVITTWVPNN